MNFAYFDCFSGAAGDMIIGALLDVGLSLDDLQMEIEKLEIRGYKLSSNKVKKNSIAATKFDVKITEKQPHRRPSEIANIIGNSKLDDDVKQKSIAIFNRLAKAEARVHGEEVENVHFHEVGAVDAIIDICGTVIGLKRLGINNVYSSPLSFGTGSVETQHGKMPIPAPATADLIKGIPVKLTNTEGELTTPTGAAILTTLADFNSPENMQADRIGYGAGSRDLPDLPNLLRVMVCSCDSEFDHDIIKVLETNLDRVSPEIVGSLFEELLSAGALDVFVTPILMKKSRPGQLLTVLCRQDNLDKLAKMVFRRGLTLGIRISTIPRIKLFREETMVKTASGNVSVKIGKLDDKKLIFPEYDDMIAVMKKTDKSYDDIYFEIHSSLRKEL